MNFDPTKYMSLGLYAIGVYDADNNRYTGLIVDALMPFIANPATIVVSIHNESYSLQKILQEKTNKEIYHYLILCVLSQCLPNYP